MKRHRSLAPLLGLVLLITGCQSDSMPPVRAALTALVTPVAVHSLVAATTPHSRAAATRLAVAALDQVSFPSGSTRLASRPSLGTADLDQRADLELVSRVGRVRWWSVPGTVAAVAGYLAAHPPAGIRVSTQGTLYVWSAATQLAFDMNAYLVQDGSDVDVSIEAESTWTPPKTAIETIPPTVTSAVLDYTTQAFGSDRRRAVPGPALAAIRAGVNAMKTGAIGPAPSCPALSEMWSITLTYAGHDVVLSNGDAGCAEVAVTSDGAAQPLLYPSEDPDPYTAMVAVVDRLAAAAPEGLVPRQFRRRITTTKAAQARALSLLDALPLPPGTTSVKPPTGGVRLYDDRNQDYLVRSRWVHVALSDAALPTYLTSHVPAGSTIAHLEPSHPYAQVVEQLTGALPSPVVLTVRSWGRRVFELAASAQWSASRSAAEHVPASVRSALLTFEPEQPVVGAVSRRVQYTGAGLVALIQWLNTRQAANPYGSCEGRSSPYKIGATFHVGARVVTFYWQAGDCSATAVVNGKRAPGLVEPPTALVERLLKVHPPS